MSQPHRAATPARPNVLLIVTDDQGYGDYGCTGNPWLKTPQLDALYGTAARLQNFHTDPMCAPSRAALLTGRDSARAGVWSTLTGRYFLNREVPTMADAFRGGGYRTGMFGKWHLGDGRHYLPHDRGFDETLYHGGGVIGEMPDEWDNDYFNATFRRNGVPERFEDTYCTDVWFNEAAGFIERSVADDAPFFCYLAANAPHTPHDVHARYAQPYLDQGLSQHRARFFGMIANLDENVGRLRGRLEALGVAENTVVIYMGDNGTAGGAEVNGKGFLAGGYNAAMRGKKCWATDGGHRNLCLVSWPAGGWGGGQAGGRDVNGLTAHLDLLPTLRGACGLADAPSDGRDLSAALGGAGDAALDGRTRVVHNQQRDNPEKYKDFAVMTADWRLVQTRDWGPGRRELTNARADPQQRHDVSAEHPEVVERLMAVYEDWWAGLEPGFDQVWPFYLDRDPAPVEMTAHAWHGTTQGPGIYDQNHCRTAVVQNGYLLVEVLEAGDYCVELRRWPRACGTAIRAGLPPRTGVPHVDDRPAGAALTIQTARLTVTPDGAATPQLDETVDVDDAMAAVTHRCTLGMGRYRVQTWLTDDAGVERGAYYVYAWPVAPRASR